LVAHVKSSVVNRWHSFRCNTKWKPEASA